jgi:hypothetical protein
MTVGTFARGKCAPHTNYSGEVPVLLLRYARATTVLQRALVRYGTGAYAV